MKTLLGLSLGDAYGAGFEYASPTIVAAGNDGATYRPHPKWQGICGRYTDDTQMSLAIAESLISKEPWEPIFLADRFVKVFKRDERTGYAKNFYAFLQSVNNGTEFLERIKNNSDRSGGAMRASVIGLLPSTEEVIKRAEIQASLTHNTVSAALLTHYFVHKKGPKSDVGVFIKKHIVGDWATDWAALWTGPVGEKGKESVLAAITAVIQSSTLKEVLIRSVGFTGDVDTVAAIAMAAAVNCEEIKDDIPASFIDGLENDMFGRNYIIELDQQLLALKES